MIEPNAELNLRGKIYTMMQRMYESAVNGSEFYLVWDQSHSRKLGLKVITGESGILDAAEREAAVLTKLSMRELPVLYDTFREGNRLLLLLEFVEGETLEKHLEAHHQDLQAKPDRAIEWIAKVCDILERVHTRKLFHRDLKPANIMLQNGRIRLIDFGLTAQSRFWNEGTIGFHAPEQAGQGGYQPIGAWTDIYSLACIAYYMVTGVIPDYDDPEHPKKSPYVSARSYNDKVSPYLDDVLRKALHRNVKHRYESVRTFRNALTRTGTEDQAERLELYSRYNAAVDRLKLPLKLHSAHSEMPPLSPEEKL